MRGEAMNEDHGLSEIERSIRRLLVLLVVSGMFLASSSLLAQGGRASITGVVTDASGSVVPGATIKALNSATGLTTSAQSTDIGSYVIPLLPVGSYAVSAQREGFKTQVRTSVTITADQAAM